MSTKTITQQVRWQDLTVKNEIDVVLEIAHQESWEDCEIFGYGDMITQPQESMGWKLIPADLYEYSIPFEGLRRVHQIINAGVRIQGVIIADDERGTKPAPKPARAKVSLPSVKPILSFIGKALLGLITVAGAIAFASLITLSLVYLAPIIALVFLVGGSADVDFDPKLVILVDDGNGGLVWVSLLTWYE